ncbi:polysaccharide pyruvyl transferase family protein [Holdemania filiformis]|uniref:Polysaccharide pyruvyl transferase n=1 Tax=Holdemania filiformis DSM 12042 TaxID=545696 RepID=B9Y9S3_9FIRM|nr:polysaccharide pyruvyl transferase family protein [Holdemania filiformis]EEF67277.1 polysaccharide pyruvyl transferase [Holdemania filiformis DSM 12042]
MTKAILWIKSKLNRKLWFYIRAFFVSPDVLYILRKLKKNDEKKRIVILGTSEYGNFGDHAISEAILDFIDSCELNSKVFEINGAIYKAFRKEVIKIIHKDDIIILPGGGWLSDIYKEDSDLIFEVCNLFENEIVIFPQTVYFSNNCPYNYYDKLQKAFQKENIHIFVRDQNSFKLLNRMLINVDIKLTPDIVTCISEKFNVKRKEKILLCLRQDAEKNINYDVEVFLSNLLNNYCVEQYSTVENILIKIKNRRKKMRKKIYEVAESQLIVTDRLHGMLFALITGTPCIALDNSTHKVSGVYAELDNLYPYIRYVEDIWTITPDSVIELIGKANAYDKSILKDMFSPLEKLLKELDES